MRLIGITGIVLLGCFMPLAGRATLSSDAAAELLANNPFTGPVSEKKTVEIPQFELRGVIKEKDGYLLNVYDIPAKKSAWVKEGRQDGEFILHSYDPVKRVAALESHGRNFTLAARPSGFSSPAAGMAMLAQAQSPAAPPVMVTPPPADEMRRMELTAREIRSRREERRKAFPTDKT